MTQHIKGNLNNEKIFISNANFSFANNTICFGGLQWTYKKYLPKEKEHAKLIKKLGNGNISCGLQDKAGNLWFGTSDNGLYKYDGKSFRQFLVTKIIEDKKGNLWFGDGGGLARYDGRSFTNFREGLINPWIWAILKDTTGKLWMDT